MATLKVFTECVVCSGTGLQPTDTLHGPGAPVPCTWPGCNGTGYYEIGFVEVDPSLGDLQDKHQDILDKLNYILRLLQA